MLPGLAVDHQRRGPVRVFADVAPVLGVDDAGVEAVAAVEAALLALATGTAARRGPEVSGMCPRASVAGTHELAYSLGLAAPV